MSRARPLAGAPIAGHVALLVALVLVATYVVNVAVIVALPPRPPAVAPIASVFSAFERGYAEASAGKAAGRSEFGDFRIEGAPPRAAQSPPFARDVAAHLATRLNRPANQVIISFERPPADVIIYREMRHLGRPPHGDHVHGRSGRPHPDGFPPHSPPPPGPPPPAPAIGAPPPPPEPPRFETQGRGTVFFARFVVAAQMADGRWLVLRQKRSSADLQWLTGAALGIGGAFAIALALGLVFAARLAAPIRRFADAAHRVGVDRRGEPIPEDGPRELRVAARAVNAMQARLGSLVADRTQMLAAVAHDLRTPLMRMRLSAENADPAVRDAIARDAEEIDELVASFIAFARDDPSHDARVKLDLAALAQSVVDDRAATGAAVTYEGPDRIVLTGQPLGLKLMLSNLVENGVRHGGSAAVRLSEAAGVAVVVVSDNGPGIPPERREDVFQPFVRLAPDGASGAGLGLAVVGSVVRAHGGAVAIDDAPGGGARVTVRLPI